MIFYRRADGGGDPLRGAGDSGALPHPVPRGGTSPPRPTLARPLNSNAHPDPSSMCPSLLRSTLILLTAHCLLLTTYYLLLTA